MIPEFIGEPSIESFLAAFLRLQNTLLSLSAKADEQTLTTLKNGAALTLAIANMMVDGKNPQDFTRQDWKEVIADAGIAINVSRRDYSAPVFLAYADYIQTSASILYSNGAPYEQFDAICDLAEEIRELDARLDSGTIDEARFVEKCLCILRESVTKLSEIITS